MNSISLKLVSFLVCTAALTVASSTVSARAETPSTDSSIELSEPTAAPSQVDASAETPAATADPLATNSTPPAGDSAPVYAPFQTVEPAETAATTVDPLATAPAVTPIPEQAASQPYEQQATIPDPNANLAEAQGLQEEAIDSNQPTSPEAIADSTPAEPMPGTVSTSATTLLEQPETSPVPTASSEQEDTSVAQSIEDIDPGRTTRGGFSYIGIGGSLGLSGDTGIGQGGFMINSKIGLTPTISFRPAVIIGDSTDFLLPLTYDFIIQSTDPFSRIPFAPFLGGGVAFSTDGDNTVGFLLTGGTDFPISRQFVANAAVNAGFFGDTTSFGISLGVGYTFGGF